VVVVVEPTGAGGPDVVVVGGAVDVVVRGLDVVVVVGGFVVVVVVAGGFVVVVVGFPANVDVVVAAPAPAGPSRPSSVPHTMTERPTKAAFPG
jgi:hypothetical protein